MDGKTAGEIDWLHLSNCQRIELEQGSPDYDIYERESTLTE